MAAVRGEGDGPCEGDGGPAADPLHRVDVQHSIGDITNAALFESILADEEHHVDYFETQLGLLDTLGEALYIQNVSEHPSPA